MSHDCGCGRPIADTATVCITCGYDLDAALETVATYLARELEVTATRQARIGPPGARGSDTPLPYAEHAATARDQLRKALTRWAGVIHRETAHPTTAPPAGPVCVRCGHGSCKMIRPIAPPPTDLAHLAAWLRPRVGWLRYHPHGNDAHRQITDTVAQARRVIDRPADRIYAGPCDCGTDLYGRIDASYVTCHDPSHETPLAWPVEARRRWLLENVRDVLATTTEIARAVTTLQGQTVTTSRIRGYVHRGRLIPRGERKTPGRKPAPLYRVGDFLNILEHDAVKASA